MNVTTHKLELDSQSAENTVAPSKKKFVEGLSFLRGIAALSVCLYHFTGGALPKLKDPSIERLFSNGWLGVGVFL